MTSHAVRRTAPPALALAALLLTFPGGVAATTNEPIAQTHGMTSTLPFIGTSLTVGVALDAVGNISNVNLSPPGLLTQTSADLGTASFSNAGGTAKLGVRAKGDRLTIVARAKLSTLAGSATWWADVFGTGSPSTVAYVVGSDGSGNPTLAIGAVSTAAGVTSQLVGPKSKSRGKSGSVVGGVTFTRNGYTKQLTIAVTVKKSDGSAAVQVSLGGRDRQKLTGTLAALAGPRTWSAHLCNATPVSVTFHVAADGKVVFDGATGAPVTTKTRGNGFSARFNDSRVGVAASLKALADGTYRLQVQGSSGSCGPGHDKHDQADKHDSPAKHGSGPGRSGGSAGSSPGWGH